MKKFILAFSVVALVACGGEEPTKKRSRTREKTKSETPKENEGEAVTFDKDQLFGIIKSIPSPLETSTLLKEIGAPFSSRVLNPTDNKDSYTTSDKQALNLGIYGADLGYVNVFEDKSSSVSYLMAVKQLADKLKIGQFFDPSTIQRMNENKDNLDSLEYISQRGFDQMNNYLEKQNRTDVSAQLIIGGWIEASYLATQAYKTNENERLKEVIGEQKVAFEEIMGLIDAFRSKRKFHDLAKGFDQLKTVFEKVTIEYIEGEETMQIVNGVPTMMSTSQSVVKITQEQIDEITKSISDLRSKIIE